MPELTKDLVEKTGEILLDIMTEYHGLIVEKEPLPSPELESVSRSRVAALALAVTLLERHAEEDIPISVEERMPAKNGEYQTWHEQTSEPHLGLWACPTEFYDGEFWALDENGERSWVLRDVTYWLPMRRAPVRNNEPVQLTE